MRIYKAEKDAGISFEEGSSSAFVTALAQVRDITEYFDGMSIADLAKSTNTVQTVEELLGQDQPDLALIVAILVSTGWNLNDDIFTPAEVWAARSTALHKPMNDNHQADKILGHIVQTRAVDKSGNEIEVPDGESPPSEFDIEVAGVLYRAFPELATRIDEIITKAKAGEMFVSMEAWFPDFGYGIIDPDTGVTKLIERTEATAFLTKHLRIYGGSGKYQGHKVGRVLKDIIFGAQGFVDDPANPESVIKVAAKKVADPKVFVTAELSEIPEGGVEDVNEKEFKELQAKLEEALANVKTKTQEVVDLQKAAEEFAAKDYDGQITALNTKVEELTTNVAKTSEKVITAETANTELQGKLDEATKCVDKSEAELDGIRKDATSRERLAKLSEVKKITDEESALAELREMTDETFEVVLKYAGETKAEVVDDKTSDNTDENSVQDKKAEQAEAALEKVVEDKSADFNAKEDGVKTKAEKWLSTATLLCKKEEEEEGGE